MLHNLRLPRPLFLYDADPSDPSHGVDELCTRMQVAWHHSWQPHLDRDRGLSRDERERVNVCIILDGQLQHGG